jgi:DNA-binding NarL/FixJ family response regulator
VVEDAPRRAPLRVAIAEDSGLLRAGIARLITDAGHRVIAEASDGPGFLEVIGE